MAIRKRGNCYQVVYRCAGESSTRTESFKTEEEALIRDAQIRLAKKNHTFEPPMRLAKGVIQQKKEIIMQDFLEEWCHDYGLRKWGNSFYSMNKGLIRNYINPFLGERYVRSITVRDIDSYYAMLLEQPAVVVSGHHDTGEKISAHTVSRIHKLLKSAFNKAVVWEYADINPTKGATLPTVKSEKRAVWSDEEAIAALNACEHPALRICLYLALGCSMRLGEILGLQWSNVHIEPALAACGEAYLQVDRELHRCTNESIRVLEEVNRSTVILKFPPVTPKAGTTTLVLKAPKTESSYRNIYLPMAVIEELNKVKAQQDEYKEMFGDTYQDYDLVVCQINGRPYEIRNIDKMFYRLIEENQLRPVVFHSLRHSSTSLKLKLSRGNIKAVQGDTGHAEARMVTDTYAHGFDADRKLIAQEMDSGFFAKVGQKQEPEIDTATLEQIKSILRQHPELLREIEHSGNG